MAGLASQAPEASAMISLVTCQPTRPEIDEDCAKLVLETISGNQQRISEAVKIHNPEAKHGCSHV